MLAQLLFLAATLPQVGVREPIDEGLVFRWSDGGRAELGQLEPLGFEARGWVPAADGFDGAGWSVDENTGAFLDARELGPVWAWEFWVRPDGRALSASLGPETAQLRFVDSSGRAEPVLTLMARRQAEVGLAESTSAERVLVDVLPAGKWSHVALAVDARTLGSVRLIVNGQVLSRVLDKASEAATANGLGPMLWAPKSDLRFTMDELRSYDRFVSTAELEESRLTALAKRESVGVAKPVVAWTQTSLATKEAWAAGRFEQVIADDSAAVWVPGQWRRDRPNHGPHPRTCHAVVSIGAGRLLVFGGELRDTHSGPMANGDDTWIYHLDEARWERVGDERTALAPGPRCHMGMAFDPVTGKAFLLSGWFNTPDGGPVYEDVWLFDTNALRWEPLTAETPVPGISDVEPVFHAGLGRFLFLSRSAAWSLDPAVGELRREPDPLVVDASFQPLERKTPGQAMTWYDPVFGVVVRFGGSWSKRSTPSALPMEGPVERKTRSSQDVLVYSAAHEAWVLRPTPASPAKAPSPRVRGAVAFDTALGQAVLFGGITGGLDERANDLWTYDFLANTWTEQRAANPPGPRGGYFGMGYDVERDELVVPFGRQDRMTFLDEVWRLRLRPEQPGVATWRFDRAAWPAGLELQLVCLDADGETALVAGLVWRVSEDGAQWGEWRQANPASNGATPAGRYLEVQVTLDPGTRLTKLAFE